MENKKTYDELKAAGDMRIADWFNVDEKIGNRYPWQAIQNTRTCFEIVLETEKAFKAAWRLGCVDGEHEVTRYCWVPKSAIESASAHIAAKASRFEEGCKRYDRAIAFAKEHGVKGVRIGMRLQTILAKIQSAGLVYTC